MAISIHAYHENATALLPVNGKASSGKSCFRVEFSQFPDQAYWVAARKEASCCPWKYVPFFDGGAIACYLNKRSLAIRFGGDERALQVLKACLPDAAAAIIKQKIHQAVQSYRGKDFSTARWAHIFQSAEAPLVEKASILINPDKINKLVRPLLIGSSNEDGQRNPYLLLMHEKDGDLKIGSGMFGIVYSAIDLGSGESYALKTNRTDIIDNSIAKEIQIMKA